MSTTTPAGCSVAPPAPVDVIITIADYTAAVQYIARGGRWYRREIPFKQPLAEQLDDNGTSWHLSTSRSLLTEI